MGTNFSDKFPTTKIFDYKTYTRLVTEGIFDSNKKATQYMRKNEKDYHCKLRAGYIPGRGMVYVVYRRPR